MERENIYDNNNNKRKNGDLENKREKKFMQKMIPTLDRKNEKAEEIEL